MKANSMKENKFRMWDGKVMWEPVSIQTFAVKPMVMEGLNCSIEDLIFLQFTGLKDKNGKEIYEGDIVAWTNWKDKRFVGTVVYEGGGFEIEQHGEVEDGEGFYGYEGQEFMWDDVRQIGNIHENPELL